MTRLLVAGVGPRPGPGQNRVFAPGLRLHTFVGELVRAGHEIHVAEALFGGRKSQDTLDPPPAVAGHHPLPPDVDEIARELSRLCRETKPEGLVALTDIVALAAARSEFEGPLYVDYNGHPMAERQMQAAVHDSNASLAGQWEYVLPALLRADAFATCSRAQRLALIGELGVAGRINAETCGYNIVHVLRPPNPFDEEFHPGMPGFLRGGKVPSGSRIMLFTGGYNTWLDDELLFEAVEEVLSSDERAVYVSTGGAIEGHVSRVFERFLERVEASPHRERYKFLGWLDHREYEQCCLEADVGVMTDRWTLEGELGCRNRLYGWIWGGMRAVATDLAEIVADELGPLGLVESVPMGDRAGFAAAIGRELQKGRCGEQEAAERRKLLVDKCSPEAYYGPLLEWAASPKRAPDRGEGLRPRNPLADWQSGLEPGGGLDSEMRELLERLAGSRGFRVFLGLHPEIAELFERIRKRPGS